MRDSLEPGLAHEKTTTVTPEMGVAHLGDAGNVISTPSLVQFIEMTCLEAITPHVNEDEQSVGTMVHVWHRAAARTGEEITARCKLIERDRRRCLFEFQVDAGDVRIGDGTHERFVIKLDQFRK